MSNSGDRRIQALLALLDEFLIAIVVIVVLIILLWIFNLLTSIPVLIAVGLILIMVIVIGYKAAQSQLKEPFIDAQKIVGRIGRVVSDLDPVGVVYVAGEMWTARSVDNSKIPRGSRVIVRRIEGLTIYVEKLKEG